MKKIILFSLCCLLLTNSATAKDKDLAKKISELELQIQTLQKEYDSRIAEMQAAMAELKAKEEEDSSEEELYAQLQNKAELSTAPVTAKNGGLNISSVLDFNYYHDRSKEGLGHMREEIAGFGHHHEGEGHHHHHGDKEGFNLRHIELGLSTEVDPYFRAWTTLAFEDGAEVEVEEAVVQTTNLPKGFTLSAGKFKSGIGRLNRQHSHNWDFFDAPLVYQKFFGHHGLNEKGLQLTWLAPTSQYLLLGAELGNGDNEAFGHYIGGEHFPKHNAPRLYTTFVKYSPEIGQRQSLQLGLSYGTTHCQREEEDETTMVKYRYDGRNKIYGADFVYKYYGLQDKGKGDWTFQGEYFYRNNEMDLLTNNRTYTNKQDGFYVQALYGIAPRWRLGTRFDNLGMKNLVEEFGEEPTTLGKSRRTTAMLDYKLSEYSLLRFQVARNNFATHEGREKAWEYALQLQVSLGSHPAHDF